jgi:serine phosphatase RsbU (regulator of sigma subunit)
MEIDTDRGQGDRLRRAASTENNELVGELHNWVARAEKLQELTTALGDALTTQAVTDAIVSWSGERLDTSYATVLLLDGEGRSVRFLRLEPVPDEVARLMAKIPTNLPSATTDVLSSRKPVYHRSLGEYLGDYPHLREATEALGVKALAHLPLIAADKLLGLLSLSWCEERSFEPEEQRFLTTVASQCALAVQRAELFEEKSEVAAILQRAILPRQLPHSPHVRLAARYLPAEAGMDVGGDWYDAFHGPDDRLWFSVGDVAGHGVAAASIMGQLRNAIHATAYADLDPAAGLDVADCMLSRLDDPTEDPAVATAIVAVLDPTTGRLSWSNAGHPPPVLMPAVGPPFLLDERHGPLLGIGHVGRKLETADLGPGDLLLLYTDGLVESRERAIDVDLSRLLQALAQSPPSDGPNAVADHALAASLSGITRRDDLCVLAIQLPATASVRR